MTYEFENTNIAALVTNKHVVCEDDEQTVEALSKYKDVVEEIETLNEKIKRIS